jgi:methyl-accepting chemotaxis protein
MKLKYRLLSIVTLILVAAGTALAVVLVGIASSMQMAAARESQERLAAEQALLIRLRYETYLWIARTLADAIADYDEAEPGRQRNRFDQFMKSVVLSNDQVVGIFAVFKPNTIDPGMDADFAGMPGSTETGQWAPWYSQRTGIVEHLTYNDIPSMMAVLNGPGTRMEKIDDPVVQNVEGKNIYIVRLTVPVIHRRTGEVVGLVGVNINTTYTQLVVDETIKNHIDITAMTVYSGNGFIVASYAPEQVGNFLREVQSTLYDADTARAHEAVVRGEKFRLTEYSNIL